MNDSSDSEFTAQLRDKARKRAKKSPGLTTQQKHKLAQAVSSYPCIWKIDDRNFQRPQASDAAFSEIAVKLEIAGNKLIHLSHLITQKINPNDFFFTDFSGSVSFRVGIT